MTGKSIDYKMKIECMADKNLKIITIPIAALILSIIASAILYLFLSVVVMVTSSNYNLGWPLFLKTTVVCYVIILSVNIYEKLKIKK